MTYELHPLCVLFPRMAPAEFNSLRDDIKANGLRTPITLHDGMILDGGNRYQACIAAGVEPQFVNFGGGNIVSFVLSANLHRRHMSLGQQAAIVSTATDWAKAQKVGRPGNAEALPHLSTVADRAAVSGATERTQRDADKLVREHPEKAKEVIAGKRSLYKAVQETKPAPAAAPDRSDELSEAAQTITSLSDEVDELRAKLAVESMDASDEAKGEAAEIIANLRALVKTLTAELDAMRISRDRYQADNAELMKQLRLNKRELDKARAA